MSTSPNTWQKREWRFLGQITGSYQQQTVPYRKWTPSERPSRTWRLLQHWRRCLAAKRPRLVFHPPFLRHRRSRKHPRPASRRHPFPLFRLHQPCLPISRQLPTMCSAAGPTQTQSPGAPRRHIVWTAQPRTTAEGRACTAGSALQGKDATQLCGRQHVHPHLRRQRHAQR